MTTLTIPAALYDTACAIAQALDTDSGGAASWGPRTTSDSDGNVITPETYRTSGTFGRPADTLAALLAEPQALHEFVAAEYKARWADSPPTLTECQAFCAGVVVVGNETDVQPTNDLEGR